MQYEFNGLLRVVDEEDCVEGRIYALYDYRKVRMWVEA